MQKAGFARFSLGAVLMFAAASMGFAQSPSTPASPATPDQQVQPSSPAQPSVNGEQGAASPASIMTNQLTRLLNLSDTQSAKVLSVLEEAHGKLVALRDDPTLSPEDKEAKLLVIRHEMSQGIMSVLSPEQQQKLMQALQQQEEEQQGPSQQQPPQD